MLTETYVEILMQLLLCMINVIAVVTLQFQDKLIHADNNFYHYFRKSRFSSDFKWMILCLYMTRSVNYSNTFPTNYLWIQTTVVYSTQISQYINQWNNSYSTVILGTLKYVKLYFQRLFSNFWKLSVRDFMKAFERE